MFGLANYNSLGEFAEALDMSLPNLSAYIHETRGPGSPFFKKMKKLGCDLDWLFTDEESNINDKPSKSELHQLRTEIKILHEKLEKINKLINIKT